MLAQSKIDAIYQLVAGTTPFTSHNPNIPNHSNNPNEPNNSNNPHEPTKPNNPQRVSEMEQSERLIAEHAVIIGW